MAVTTFSGPVRAGTNWDLPTVNTGDMVLSQHATVTHGVGRDTTLTLPASSQIIDIIVDVLTAFNSFTSDTLSVGIAIGGTQYASGVDVRTSAIRIRPTFTAAQLANLQNITTNVTVHINVTHVGAAATAGDARITILYRQRNV